MHAWTDVYVHELLTFALVLVRVSALVMIAPIFGPSAAPLRVRALLALVLALVIAPLELAKSTPRPETLAGCLVPLGAEALIGLALGLGVLLLFSAMHLAGQLISQMSGLQLADVFNPGFDTSVPVISQLLFYVTMAVFVTIGGHRRVVEALLDTFEWLPAGQGSFSRSITEAMTSLLAESFVLAVRAAAPAMVALLLATLILGLVGRTLPQLNVMALGFSVNSLTALATLGISLGAAAWIFQARLEPALETVLAALKTAAVSQSR
jgi:flagellar biosynthetic protein FliR